MNKKFPTTTVSLSKIATILKNSLDKTRPYGWFSKFVSEQLIEHYGRNFEEKVLVHALVEKQNKRDALEKEIGHLGDRLEKIRGKIKVRK
jgi:hypothetical protein